MKKKSHFTIIALAVIFLAVILMACRNHTSCLDIDFGGGRSTGNGGNFPPLGQQFKVTVLSYSTGLGPSFTNAGPFTGPPTAHTATAAPAAIITATPGQLVTITTTRPDPILIPLNCTLEFGKWLVDTGDVTFTNSWMRTSKTATFIMPAEDVVIEAIFVDGSIFGTVTDLGGPFGGYADGALRYSVLWLNWAPPANFLIIPGSIAGETIELIGCGWGNAFFVPSFTSVSIPYSVTHIGYYAFAQSILEHVYIPGTVTYIGGSAFNNSPSLDSVTFGDGVQRIMNSVFGWTNLDNVTIPASVIFIGDGAFEGNPNLTEVTILGNNVTLGLDPFLFSPPANTLPCSFFVNFQPIITLPGTFEWIAGDWVRQ